MKVVSVRVADLASDRRHRKEMGDISRLADSIQEIGLLHPLVITPDNKLVAGRRRLAAVKKLGWEKVDAHIVANLTDAIPLLKAERDENTCRLDYLPTEAGTIGAALEALEKKAAKERQEAGRRKGGKIAGRGRRKAEQVPDNLSGTCSATGEAAARTAEGLGMGHMTYKKIKAVMKAAKENPELYGHLPAVMDDKKGKGVDKAYREMRRIEKEAAEAAAKEELEKEARKNGYTPDVHCLSMQEFLPSLQNVDAIITDPPYSQEFLPLYGELAKLAKATLKPDGVLAVMCGQSYLPHILALMTPHIEYRWTLAYLTPGGQSVQVWNRKINTFWKPVLVFGTTLKWSSDVVSSAVNDNDKKHHDWGQSESGMAGLVERLTAPGALVCDPFLGAGTTGVVCARLGRKFIGCDIDKNHVATACDRIKKALAEGNNG